MENEYTPGPWQVRPLGGTAQWFEIISNNSKIEIAETPVTERSSNALYNAMLIASAPDLLNAAKLALRVCHFAVGSMKAQTALRAAIEKAEGKSCAPQS
jgi:hypothetical protein